MEAPAAMKSLSYTILHKSKSFHPPTEDGRTGNLFSKVILTKKISLVCQNLFRKVLGKIVGGVVWNWKKKKGLGRRSAKINDFD